jgi:hypothetical protein
MKTVSGNIFSGTAPSDTGAVSSAGHAELNLLLSLRRATEREATTTAALTLNLSRRERGLLRAHTPNNARMSRAAWTTRAISILPAVTR